MEYKKVLISKHFIISFDTLASYQNRRYQVAGEEGIEPSTTVLETVVMPFNYSPKNGLDIMAQIPEFFNIQATILSRFLGDFSD